MTDDQLQLEIELDAEVAPFQQIVGQVRAQIAEGRLAPGTRMPTVRGLAAQLGLAPNTVAKAFRELELAGVVDTRGRRGTFVAGSGADAQARAATSEFVAQMRTLGVSLDQTLAAVRGQWPTQR